MAYPASENNYSGRHLMRILLIEDSPEKIEAIKTSLRSFPFSAPVEPVIVRTLSEAVKSISITPFDLIVLDLMIPYLPGALPSSDAGYELLRELRKSGPNKFTKVISISAFPEEVAAYREKFDQFAVVITPFDDEGSWIATLTAVLSELQGTRQIPRNVDFLIICALDEEREGYRSTELESVSDLAIHGLNLRLVKSDSCGSGVILRTSSMGLVTATYETAMALQLVDTPVVAMSGICAGFDSKVTLGQLVCASLSWDYQAGKWSKDGFEIAPLQVPLPGITRALIDNYFDSEGIVQKIEEKLGRVVLPKDVAKPKLVPMATGSAVIADDQRLNHIRAQHRQVAALDMETYGVYYACHQHHTKIPHFFSMKTVVDLADRKKGDDLHYYGAALSAHASLEIIGRIRKIRQPKVT